MFAQYYLARLSQTSYLLGDETIGRAVVATPRGDVAEYGARLDMICSVPCRI